MIIEAYRAAHFSGGTDRTMRRMTMPFVSIDRYDPKDCFQYLNHVVEPHRNFFIPPEDEESFLKVFFLIFVKNRVRFFTKI